MVVLKVGYCHPLASASGEIDSRQNLKRAKSVIKKSQKTLSPMKACTCVLTTMLPVIVSTFYGSSFSAVLNSVFTYREIRVSGCALRT